MVDIVIDAGVKLSEIALKTIDMDSEEPEVKIISSGSELKRVEIWLQEINGIIYYIDGNGNIYNTEDILQNKINPKIVDNYKINDQGYYTIS